MALSPSVVAAEHQAGMHRHIGSAISEALNMLRPLHDPHRAAPAAPVATAASVRASACRCVCVRLS